MSIILPFLTPTETEFPDTRLALKDPNGLLCFGGQLSTQHLLSAYKRGIFPWFNEGEPILWWSPDPRLICLPEELHISKSLKKLAKKVDYQLRFDSQFDQVISLCAENRQETWINEAMLDAYSQLHQLGFAHSIEVWNQNSLVGGLYGVQVGGAFFGESMFSLANSASKFAFIALCKCNKSLGISMIDCQVETDYLLSMGAKNLRRLEFEQQLTSLTNQQQPSWPKHVFEAKTLFN